MQNASTTLSPEDIAEGKNFVDTTQRDISGNFERLELKGDQAKATLPQHRDWQIKNPELTVLNRYRNQHTMPQSTGYRIGSSMRRWSMGDNVLGRGFSAGALPGGLVGGLMGALGGGALGLVAQQKNESLSPGRLAVLLGLLGGGYGAYRGYQNKKASAGWREGPQHDIIMQLRNAPGLSFSERTRLMQGVQNLTPQQAERLSRMTGAAFGAGIASIVAKFLMGAGLGSTVLAGILGGVTGRALFGGAPRNALGQRSLNHHTMFGSPL